MNTIPTTSLAMTLVLGAGSGCSSGHDEAGHGEGGHAQSAGSDHHSSGHDDEHAATAIGEPGEPEQVDRTVRVEMDDAMRYVPATIEVASGETVAFGVVNTGRLRHEFVLGSADDIAEHHESMKRFPGMEHAEPNSVSLAAGETGTVVWQFGEPGTIDIACLQPGHYEAGMKGAVTVTTDS